MSKQIPQKAKSNNFSAAFERMCNFVAISETQGFFETLSALILQCFLLLEEEVTNSRQLGDAINILFGLQVSIFDVQKTLDNLREDGLITFNNDTFKLAQDVEARLQKQLDEATSLEIEVRTSWFEEISINYPTLPPEKMWQVLRIYLAKSIRRHGIQSVAYLDPSIDTNDEYSNGLSALLRQAIKETYDANEQLQSDAANAISGFLATVGLHQNRIKYIAQLADGAFNYYSLTVDPEVAEEFRKNLQPLTLFLDTNFLFGILDLHVNPLVDVSNQVIDAVTKYSLPFGLRYHESTDRELRSAIGYYGDRLKTNKWKQSLSRVAANTRNLSGIELKYHEKNAQTPLDVDSFLRPYEHSDVLLKERHIDIYRVAANHRLQEKADLLHEYNEFLNFRKKNKSASLVDHDVTVLDTVQELRNNADTTLSAGSLLLTCDYLLYKFNSELSRKQHRRAFVLLPNLFMQVLRPFIPATDDFEKSFAETFAIPEFRIVGSGAARASSRLLSLLANYADFPEPTAAKLLSNDVLLEQLETVEDDVKFQEAVEAEIVNQNNSLLEEKAQLEQQLEIEKQEKQRQEKVLRDAQVNLAKAKDDAQIALSVAKDEKLKRQKEEEVHRTSELKAQQAEKSLLEARKRIENLITIGSVVVSSGLGIIIYPLITTQPRYRSC